MNQRRKPYNGSLPSTFSVSHTWDKSYAMKRQVYTQNINLTKLLAHADIYFIFYVLFCALYTLNKQTKIHEYTKPAQ